MFQSASGLSVGGRGGEKCRRWRLRQSTCQAKRRAPISSPANRGLRLGSARQASIPFARSVSSRARSYGAVVNRRRANNSLGGL